MGKPNLQAIAKACWKKAVSTRQGQLTPWSEAYDCTFKRCTDKRHICQRRAEKAVNNVAAQRGYKLRRYLRKSILTRWGS